MRELVRIDGARGEGGGQILRTALSLAALTGTPVRIENIRARRKRPGLMRQHLTCARAVAEVCGAELDGAELGSRTIELRPGSVRAGDYVFSVGTAGSASLVMQTVIWPLLFAGGRSHLAFEGGTHNQSAPPFEFIDRCFLPVLRSAGVRVHAKLVRHGFYPAGGGRFEIELDPCERLDGIELLEGGEVVGRHARAKVSRLPPSIAERELRVVRRELGWAPADCEVEEVSDSPGPGNALVIEIERERIAEVITGFGKRGVPAEKVARTAATGARRYLDSGVPVGAHLADQLVIPLALAGKGRFRTLPLSAHTRTNIEVAQQFLPVRLLVADERDGSVVVSLGR